MNIFKQFFYLQPLHVASDWLLCFCASLDISTPLPHYVLQSYLVGPGNKIIFFLALAATDGQPHEYLANPVKMCGSSCIKATLDKASPSL